MHPSLHESGDLVCIEAMVARRPVLCLEWGAPDRVVADIAAGMKRLAGDAALRTQMDQAGRRQVESHFAWARKIDAYNAMYEEAIDQLETAVA